MQCPKTLKALPVWILRNCFIVCNVTISSAAFFVNACSGLYILIHIPTIPRDIRLVELALFIRMKKKTRQIV